MHGSSVLIDAVNEPVGAAPGAMTARERAEQRLADTAGVDGQRGFAELQHGGRDSFGQPPRDRLPRLVPADQAGQVDPAEFFD
jgi:hypothetical protein